MTDRRQTTIDWIRDRNKTNEHLVRTDIIYLLKLLDWQPLASAPRDGTFVELKGESGYVGHPFRIMIAHYEASREDAGAITKGLQTRDEHCWRTVQGDHCTDDGPMPTHWRPAS